MYRKIDHLGIAVRSLSSALLTYELAFGLEKSAIEEIPGQKTRAALLTVGESRIELLEALSEDSPVARFITKRGEGLHHICFQVDDIRQELDKLRNAGIRLIDEKPRSGAGGSQVAFVHPSGTSGVLIELSQSSTGTVKPSSK